MSLLVLTVGTGTTGKHSNLAQGLVNTLHQLHPRLFWLVPSASLDSTTLAEIVRDDAPEGCAFQPWSSTQPFRQIEQHDDLFVCRVALREVIHQARERLAQAERLIVNPTSGTKQMSVAAALAALDEGIGEIVFTVGERADGVVKTGTERMASFSTEVFFAERALREAVRLFDAGAFDGAARLLEPYTSLREAVQARDVALCLHHWQRLDFKQARRIAARSTAPALVAVRSRLDGLARSPELSVCVLAELLHSATELRRWGAFEDSLARGYRALELAAKIRLAQEHGIQPPYVLETLSDAAPSLDNKLRALARDGQCALGLLRSFEVLAALGDALARDYFDNRRLRDLFSLRNETIAGHGTENISSAQSEEAIRHLEALLSRHFSDLVSERRVAATRPSRLCP